MREETMNIFDVAGNIVIVTGGAQGIGKSIVNDFAAAGATVAIADLNQEAGEATAAEVSEASGQPVVAYRTDVTNLENVQDTVQQVIDRFGRIDVLVNNAGWDKFNLFLQTTPELWDRIIDINFKGALNTCHTVLPHMVEAKKGSIVNIASDAGRSGSLGESVYAGCKGAIIAFSKTIAREHARDNIRVNVVAPGITTTALLDAMSETDFGHKVIQSIAKAIPLGRRPGDPEEISPAVLFLASAGARYITGQVLSVSGGLTMVD